MKIGSTGTNKLSRCSLIRSVSSDNELHKIHTSLLWLIGDHEVIYKPVAAIRRATRLVIGLQAEVLLNANHIAEYTAADLVNEKILNFLA
jgi:hypothetical protein